MQPDARADVARVCELDVAAWMQVAEQGQRLSSDRSSAAARVELAGQTYLVKWRRPRRGRRWRTFLRASRERLEARALLRLLRLDLFGAAPLAVGERRSAGCLEGSVLIREFLPGQTAAQTLADGPEPLLALAETWRTWHERGLRHGDAYPKNVLRDARGNWIPIGCPKAVFRPPGPQLDRWRLRDLAQWCVGLEEQGHPARTFLARYTAAQPAPGSAPLALVPLEAEVEPLRARIRHKKARRRASQSRREPGGPPLPAPLTPRRGGRVQELPWDRL